MMSTAERVRAFADALGMTLSDLSEAVQSILPVGSEDQMKTIPAVSFNPTFDVDLTGAPDSGKRPYTKCRRPSIAAKECEIGQIMSADERYHIVVEQRAGKGIAKRWKLITQEEAMERMQRVRAEVEDAIGANDDQVTITTPEVSERAIGAPLVDYESTDDEDDEVEEDGWIIVDEHPTAMSLQTPSLEVVVEDAIGANDDQVTITTPEVSERATGAPLVDYESTDDEDDEVEEDGWIIVDEHPTAMSLQTPSLEVVVGCGICRNCKDRNGIECMGPLSEQTTWLAELIKTRGRMNDQCWNFLDWKRVTNTTEHLPGRQYAEIESDANNEIFWVSYNWQADFLLDQATTTSDTSSVIRWRKGNILKVHHRWEEVYGSAKPAKRTYNKTMPQTDPRDLGIGAEVESNGKTWIVREVRTRGDGKRLRWVVKKNGGISPSVEAARTLLALAK